MTVAELSIPQGWEAIDAEWMTAALAGHFPNATVGDIAVVMRDDGTNRRARLQLTYSAGAGPATVFAKAVDPEHADLVALTSGLYHEPRLFSSGVVLPLDHPTVYTAIIDEDLRDFLMIMEDVKLSGAHISAGQKANVAIQHSMLIAIWHMGTNGCIYDDPGADYFNRLHPERAKKRAINQLEAMGYNVTLTHVS